MRLYCRLINIVGDFISGPGQPLVKLNTQQSRTPPGLFLFPTSSILFLLISKIKLPLPRVKQKIFNKKMETNKQNSNKNLIILFLILLLGSIGFNVYQYTSGKQDHEEMQGRIDTVYIEKQKVQAELEITSADLEKYKGVSDSLDNVVGEQQKQLQELEQKIKNLKVAAKKDASKKKELEDAIADYKQKYDAALEKIDQLITENNMLKNQNAELTTNVQSLTEEKTNLQQKVNTAALVKTEYLKIKTLKKKALGDGFAETSLAKKVDKFNICFTLLDNKLASSGDKPIHVRIIGPDKKVLHQVVGTFKRADNNEDVEFTNTLFVEYKNDGKKDVCVDYSDSNGTFPSGNYTVEVYVDQVLSARGGVVLK